NQLSLFLSANRTPKGPNYTLFSNREFDMRYDLALSETDDTARSRIYASMDSLMMADAPVVVLYYDQVLRFTQPWVEGLTPNAMNLLTLKHVRKEAGAASGPRGDVR